MQKNRILVVDDEEDLCEILQFNLEQAGYIVDTAYSAEEVIDKELYDYDLFLLDVMMPRRRCELLYCRLHEDGRINLYL